LRCAFAGRAQEGVCPLTAIPLLGGVPISVRARLVCTRLRSPPTGNLLLKWKFRSSTDPVPAQRYGLSLISASPLSFASKRLLSGKSPVRARPASAKPSRCCENIRRCPSESPVSASAVVVVVFGGESAVVSSFFSFWVESARCCHHRTRPSRRPICKEAQSSPPHRAPTSRPGGGDGREGSPGRRSPATAAATVTGLVVLCGPTEVSVYVIVIICTIIIINPHLPFCFVCLFPPRLLVTPSCPIPFACSRFLPSQPPPTQIPRVKH
jgi:hypothetical protein